MIAPHTAPVRNSREEKRPKTRGSRINQTPSSVALLAVYALCIRSACSFPQLVSANGPPSAVESKHSPYLLSQTATRDHRTTRSASDGPVFAPTCGSAIYGNLSVAGLKVTCWLPTSYGLPREAPSGASSDPPGVGAVSGRTGEGDGGGSKMG